MDHLAGVLPAGILLIFDHGRLGVPIFFVLSGFVIAHSVSRYRVDLPFVGRFILRRSIRLDPPYWFSIAVVIGFGVLSRAINPAKLYSPPTAGRFGAHLLYIYPFLGYPDINPVYWTLVMEVQFYLIFCLLMWPAHSTRRDADDRRSLYLIFGPALLLSAAWPLGIIRSPIWPGLFLQFWYGFLLGMLVCWVKNGTVGWGWFLGYAALVGAGAVRDPDPFAGACVATSVLLLLAVRTGGLGRWLRWRWLQSLGLISYSLYLLHNPITGAFYNVAFRITGRSPAMEAACLPPLIAANVAGAAAIWWLVERPSLAMAHRLRLSPPPTPAARPENPPDGPATRHAGC